VRLVFLPAEAHGYAKETVETETSNEKNDRK
jgi:hypothetical protein